VPIYEQTYRTYDGTLRRRFRWWVMVMQELRVLFAARPFVVLLIAAVLHLSFRIFQVVVYDLLASDPSNPVAVAIRQVAMLEVNESTFFDFLRIQCPLVFFISLYAGSGMICDDFRNNLTEVYFSKPISWRDYALGKIMTLVCIGLALTAVPGILLVVLHNLLAPGWDTISDTWLYPVSIVLFSLVIVVPTALGVLASSALFGSQRFAAISIFMVLFANMALGTALSGMLRRAEYAVLAFPFAVNRVGQHLFHGRIEPGISLGWSTTFVVVVCVLALWIVCRKALRGEVAA
jgi:ABC-2 type transport system permease protein